MNLYSAKLRILWDILSRTRPLPEPGPKSVSDRRRKHTVNFSDLRSSNFLYFIYQGVGVTGPFGLCYVAGVIVGEIGMENMYVAVFVAATASLLSGLCYAELISTSRRCSGHVITAVYQLVGELPAFCIAYLSLATTGCGFAAMSKALSATIEELNDGRLSAYLSSVIGTLPFSLGAPDVIAAGIALTTSILLSCGLKQAGFLRTSMNALCVVGFLFFVIIGSAYSTSDTTNAKEITTNYREILAGAGMLCSLFFQYLELGRRSKGRNDPEFPLAISCICSGVVIFSLTLSVVLSFMMNNRFVSGAPLLKAFQFRDVLWARITIGSLQVIILGLGVTEAGEAISRVLVDMASNGFIPSFLSQECATSFTHSKAHVVGGLIVAALALFFSHIYLLELMAISILLINSYICLIVLYRPRRCRYDSLCNVTVTSASRVFPKLFKPKVTEFSSRSSGSAESATYSKRGFSKAPLGKNFADQELAVPLLSSLFEESDEVIGEIHGLLQPPTRAANITDETKDDKEAGCDSEIQLVNLMARQPPLQELDCGPDNDLVPDDDRDNHLDEDIDKIVAEFKEQLHSTVLQPRISLAPTASTARQALFSILGVTLVWLVISYLSLSESQKRLDSYGSNWRKALLASLVFIELVLLVFLWSLPTARSSSKNKVARRLVPVVALLMNILVVTELLSRISWTILPQHVIGLLWYGFYVSRNSAAAKCSIRRSHKHLGKNDVKYSKAKKSREFVRLSSMNLPTTWKTFKPQKMRNLEASQKNFHL